MTDSGWSVDGVEVPLDDHYIDGTPVTHLRVFDEGDGWAIDGADEEERFTREVWKYDTHEEAVAHLAEFTEFLVSEGYTINWRAEE